MALPFNPFEGDRSLKAPTIKKKLTKLKPWDNIPSNTDATDAQIDQLVTLPEIQVPEKKVAQPYTEAQKTKLPELQVPKNKVPGIRVAEFKVPAEQVTQPVENQTPGKSFFRLNQAEAFKLLQEMDPAEFKLFLFLSMKAWGWDGKLRRLGDGTVRASVSYAAKGAGISESSVNKYTDKLIAKGLTKKLSVSFKQGNTYQVSSVIYHQEKSPELPAAQVPEIRVPEKQAPSYLNGGQLGTRQTSTNIDSIYLESLSHENPIAWNEFLTQLTEKERERSARVFKSLKTQFPDDPVEEIAECPRNLERFGAPDGTPWAKIKSPIGLMESSWPKLRDFFRTHLATEKRAEMARAQAAVDQAAANAEDERAAQEDALRDQAFAEAFPTDEAKQEAFVKYIALSGLGLRPDSKMGKHTAMSRWWSETKANDNRVQENKA